MRNIMAVLLTGLLSAPTLVFASERPTGEPTTLTPPTARSWPRPFVKALDWLAGMELRVRWADLQQPSQAGIRC